MIESTCIHMTPSLIISSETDTLLHFLPTDGPRRNTFPGLIFILSTAGEATIEMDGSPYILQPGTLLSLLPSHLLNTTAIGHSFQCFTIAFTFDTMADFPYMLQSCISEAMEVAPAVRLTPDESKRLEDWHETITRHYQKTMHPSYEQMLHSLFFIFTAEVSAIYSGRPLKASATRNEELADGFFRLLHKHFRTNRNAAFYASQLCISSKYLSKIIHEVTGHSPSHWIADFTIREAKTLLKSTSLTVTQLSDALNFPNSSFFARFFKRHTKTSPVEYRIRKEG